MLWYLVDLVTTLHHGLPKRLSGKEPVCQRRRCGFNLWFRKTSWRWKWQPTQVFLPGKSHGRRSISKKISVSRSVVPVFLRPHGLQPTRLLCPQDFPSKDTGVDWHFLLQGIFSTQGSNLGLLHCRQILYRLSYKGSPQNSMVGYKRVKHNLEMKQQQ